MARTESTMLELGTPAPDFSLPDVISGTTVSLADFAGKPLLVAFICVHCPYVQLIRHEFARYAREYMPKGLAVVGIQSNDIASHPEDGPDSMRDDARRFRYGFPYLLDEKQDVAKAYFAACTPDLFLFDADHRLYYRGEFDASRPGSDVPVTGNELRAATDALLAGHPAPAEQRPSMGCNIKWKPGNEPAYYG
ncbi:thioredoxin family protein [Acidihalobacter ferrooxydans]|uniref:Thioredoxin family protein n=1 Tax=Acidihalobacter ferrooxydans TaxID=1765967 RepID=A0A1P8UDZ9_9GAMM|nr:thioredoxin family protein [Acidihalobacter ferrooxydans]APZ42008.1 thioredoxin family protein [Acidihalobacter ferrooxydans]